MEKLQTRLFNVSFTTPAFLGNADQQGQWRVPPFKAALRHWWRIAVAREVKYEHKKLLEREEKLFGCAGRSGEASKSRVQLRLSSWEMGKNLSSQELKSDGAKYLAYGPINKKDSQPLSDKQIAKLSLRFPERYEKEIDQALNLLAWFGTLGSRSRNGWGSLHMSSDGHTISSFSKEAIRPYLRELFECMKYDWPHAIGMDDDRPLVWQSEPLENWSEAIDKLAELKKDMRREAKKDKRDINGIAGIHLLGYPAGKDWPLPCGQEQNMRMATPIRFKVVKDDQKCRCLVFHIPTDFPSVIKDQLDKSDREWVEKNQVEVFRAIHQVIDNNGKFQRIGQNDE